MTRREDRSKRKGRPQKQLQARRKKLTNIQELGMKFIEQVVAVR